MGLEIILLLMLKRVRRTQVVYVDDVDFYFNVEDSKEKTKEIVDVYVNLHEKLELKSKKRKQCFIARDTN